MDIFFKEEETQTPKRKQFQRNNVLRVLAIGDTTPSVKKQDAKLLAITSPTIIRFSNFFHYLTR